MRANARLFVIAGLLVGLGLAILVSPFASSQPDGLEKVAAEEEFADAAQDHDLADGPLADYGTKGVGNDKLGTAVAGVIGTLLTFGIGLGLFALVRTLRRRPDDRPPVAA